VLVHGLLLCRQTLLALMALGLAGGWALRPFERDDRPYLWLAAPLAGLFTLGGSMVVLYYGFRVLTFGTCLGWGSGLNAAATIIGLVRRPPGRPPWRRWVAGAAATLAAAVFATVVSNQTAITSREPTLTELEGTDMFGYAIGADWLRAHTASEPPRLDHYFEGMIHIWLFEEGDRPVTFFLAAAASEVRGTSSLFSYDWASGVVLAAAVVGFAGAFASDGLVLAVLLVGGGTTNWLANARTGFMGKSVAYPGTLLLTALLLSTVEKPSRSRVGVLAAVGASVAYSIAPALAAVVLTIVAIGYACSRAAFFHRDRSFVRPVALMLALVAVTVLPAFLRHYSTRRVLVPVVPVDWSVVIPVAFDLEPPAAPLLSRPTEHVLLCLCGAVLLTLAGLAFRRRQVAALALLACAGAVPGTWLLGLPLIFSFQGIIYPLTLAGAAHLARTRWAALLLAGLVALHVPTIDQTARRYLDDPRRAILRESEMRSLRNAIGAESVDVMLGYPADSLLVVAELLARGARVQLRQPAWERSLRTWALSAHASPPDLLAPKARYSLVERNAETTGEERWSGTRLKLVEDREGVAVVGIADNGYMLWDSSWRPGVRISREPVTFLINNGTPRPQSVRFLGHVASWPGTPLEAPAVLAYGSQQLSGVALIGQQGRAVVPLVLPPGLSRVELGVEKGPDLLFANWRFRPGEKSLAP
jgi:hypothetical protein